MSFERRYASACRRAARSPRRPSVIIFSAIGLTAFAFATVVTIAPIKAGEKLTTQNLWVKRPGTGSIPAEKYEALLGKKALRDLPADVHLTHEDFS